MAARSTPEPGFDKGNFVSEWFGHQVWPELDRSTTAYANQASRGCPFITVATGFSTPCVKTSNSFDEPYGVCTISSDSNGRRQNWIACPYRTFDQHSTLLDSAVRWAYQVGPDARILLLPVTALGRAERQHAVPTALSQGVRVFLFSGQKMGGELELSESEASPGASVDISVVEVKSTDKDGVPNLDGDHFFYEIQTADFHGSPLHAASLLKECCPKDGGPDGYHSALGSRLEVCGTGVEGPNKANIFKRTIYQMLFKIAIAQHGNSAGFAIVLPAPVWDSWLTHLGKPAMEPSEDGEEHVFLLSPDEKRDGFKSRRKATIYVFDIDRDAPELPSPLRIIRRISCSSQGLAYYAFEEAAQKALEGNVVEKFRRAFLARILAGWKGTLRDQKE